MCNLTPSFFLIHYSPPNDKPAAEKMDLESQVRRGDVPAETIFEAIDTFVMPKIKVEQGIPIKIEVKQERKQ